MILTTNDKGETFEDGYYPKSDTYILVCFEAADHSATDHLAADHSASHHPLKGEFRHLYMDEFRKFDTISEFIYKLQQLLEAINTPQATTECRRTWKNCTKTPLPPENLVFLENASMAGVRKKGESFLIHIRYRCNASWQGEIKWLWKNHSMTFRSVLELLMVLEDTVVRMRSVMVVEQKHKIED